MNLRRPFAAFTLVIAFAGAAIAAAQTPGQAIKPIPAPPDVAAPPADAERTRSGVASKVLKPASESTQKVNPTDLVTVHYTGWTTDGKMFDSSRSRGKPSTFPLDRVIPGWRECVQLMTLGESRRCWVPEELAYKGQPGRPAGMLVFDIDLIGAESSPTAAPVDVAGAPADAKRTASGLAYKVIKPGTGDRHPRSSSRVTVHYTGWTTDGKMFDSSITRGQPATFGLDQVIRGWTEGVQLMVEGEKARFWIPEKLAYQGQPGAPQGMLVFDVELIKIEN